MTNTTDAQPAPFTLTDSPGALFGMLHLLTDLADDSPGGRVAAAMREVVLTALESTLPEHR